MSEIPPVVPSYLFVFCKPDSATCTETLCPNIIYVPSNAVTTYKSADVWKKWASHIQPIPEDKI